MKKFILIVSGLSMILLIFSGVLDYAEPDAYTMAAKPVFVYTPTNTPIPAVSALLPTPTPAPSIYANILIDPGHGGDDHGADVDFQNLNEKDINLTIALRLYRLLQQDYEKIRVNMTRFDETTVSKLDRVEMANTSADFFISIHCNANAQQSAHGITTYFQTHDSDKPFTSKELAEAIQRNLVEVTGAYDRGIQYSDKLFLLNHTAVPTILVETGFLTNAEELRLLLDDSYVDLMAEGFRQGILEMADHVIASQN